MVDGRPFKLSLHDTGSCLEEDRQTSQQSVDVFLLMFSVVDLKSFENVQKKWAPWLNRHFPKIPVVVVGNKTDLRDSCAKTSEDGKKLAGDIGAKNYTECSVRTQEGLRGIFDEVVNAVMNKKVDESIKKKSKQCTIL